MRSPGPSIKIPDELPWGPISQFRPFLVDGESDYDKLVDVDNAVKEALEIVAELKDKSERVPPTVINRLPGGGKTTLLDLIARKLNESG